MVISAYNIILKRLKHDDIELVRNWRNSETVSQYMEKRDQITPEQQEEWFKKIDTIHHNYYIIIENKIPVGLIYGSEIDWEKGITGNGGIFLSDEQYFHSDIPLRAAFSLIDTGISVGLIHQYVKVLKDNDRAKFFNKCLGYEIMEGEENNSNQKYYLQADRYLKKTGPLKKALGFENEKLIFSFDDPSHPVYANTLAAYNKLAGTRKIIAEFHTA
jgi:RimJ/RimL family protein N-acetyltransferase